MVSSLLMGNLPYDVQKDFEPVTMVARGAMVLCTSPLRPYRTLADVVAAAKSQPNTLSYATTGIGSPLSGELYTLNSVAAVVLGGVALVGGKGGLIGPIIAAFVVSIVVAILVFWGVDSNYAQVIQGALMVLVVMVGGLIVLRDSK